MPVICWNKCDSTTLLFSNSAVTINLEGDELTESSEHRTKCCAVFLYALNSNLTKAKFTYQLSEVIQRKRDIDLSFWPCVSIRNNYHSQFRFQDGSDFFYFINSLDRKKLHNTSFLSIVLYPNKYIPKYYRLNLFCFIFIANGLEKDVIVNNYISYEQRCPALLAY